MKNFAVIPSTFTRDFLSLLPTSVVFCDPVNSTMDVNIVKAKNAAYFTDEWIEILEYYNIPDGAFIKLIYHGHGHGLFDIVSLQNLYFQEVDYPVSPRKFEFDAAMDRQAVDMNAKVTELFEFVFSFQKTLTKYQACCSSLLMILIFFFFWSH